MTDELTRTEDEEWQEQFATQTNRKKFAMERAHSRMEYLASVGDEALNNTYEYVESLKELLKSLGEFDPGSIEIEPLEIDPVAYGGPPRLDSEGIDTEPPSPDKEYELDYEDVDTSPLDEGKQEWPNKDFNTPQYDIPEKPETEVPPINEVVGELGDLDQIKPPSSPTFEPLKEPELNEVVVPPPDDFIDMPPPFEAELVPWNVDSPGEFTWHDQEHSYSSDIWSELLAKTLESIKNGGTGLDPQVEEDIYWQHLNRTQAENEKLFRDAENYWAARGFTMPPGMLSAQINEINNHITKNNLQASKDITISQAELAQKNTQFFIDKGVQLESMLRDFFIKQINTTLQAQRSVAENSIAIYNTKVEEFNYHLEEYKSKAAVYSERVKASEAKASMYKSVVEGVKAQSEAEQSKVQLYSVLMAARQTEADLYKTQMEGESLKAQLNSLKLEEFRSKVNLYTSMVDAEKTKVEIYEAQIRGEQAKADMHRSQIEAYRSEVEAESIKRQNEIQKIEAKISRNQIYLEKYKAELETRKMQLDAWKTSLSAKVDGYRTEATAFTAEANANEARSRTKIADIGARVEEARFNLERQVEEIRSATESFKAIKELQTSGYQGIMNVGAQLAASALNAINTSTSIGYSGSDSYSQDQSDSRTSSISHGVSYEGNPENPPETIYPEK